jgi:hypothetical protein
VLVVGRSGLGQRHSKLQEIVHRELYDLSTIEQRLAGYDGGFFCLGVLAAGMNEDAYRRVIYDLTISVATTLAKVNPQMTFIYVSGTSRGQVAAGRFGRLLLSSPTEAPSASQNNIALTLEQLNHLVGVIGFDPNFVEGGAKVHQKCVKILVGQSLRLRMCVCGADFRARVDLSSAEQH